MSNRRLIIACDYVWDLGVEVFLVQFIIYANVYVAFVVDGDVWTEHCDGTLLCL